jgi:hypothetical protein
LGEYIFHVHATATVAIYTLVAKPVVAGTFILITQYFVGFGGFLKLILRCRVIGVFIRVKFNGYFPVSFFNLVGPGAFFNP